MCGRQQGLHAGLRGAGVQVTVHATVRPTEDPEEVVAAATRFFPGRVEVEADSVTVVHDDLAELRRRVWELRIIDTVRGQVLHGITSDKGATTFQLSKQAAHAGRVAIPPAPHALGELEVTIVVGPDDRFADAEAMAWWLCPETADGEIVGPMD